MRNDQSLVVLWLVIYFLKNYLDFLGANHQVPSHIHFLRSICIIIEDFIKLMILNKLRSYQTMFEPCSYLNILP